MFFKVVLDIVPDSARCQEGTMRIQRRRNALWPCTLFALTPSSPTGWPSCLPGPARYAAPGQCHFSAWLLTADTPRFRCAPASEPGGYWLPSMHLGLFPNVSLPKKPFLGGGGRSRGREREKNLPLSGTALLTLPILCATLFSSQHIRLAISYLINLFFIFHH
jgi:hypothetical protein